MSACESIREFTQHTSHVQPKNMPTCSRPHLRVGSPCPSPRPLLARQPRLPSSLAVPSRRVATDGLTPRPSRRPAAGTGLLSSSNYPIFAGLSGVRQLLIGCPARGGGALRGCPWAPEAARPRCACHARPCDPRPRVHRDNRRKWGERESERAFAVWPSARWDKHAATTARGAWPCRTRRDNRFRVVSRSADLRADIRNLGAR